MSYKEINDVTTVVLGGVDKKTRKKNPTELEGYYLREETREDKKFGKGLQPYYVFLTKDGEQGVHGKTHLNKRMKSAVIGLMTKVTATDDVLDTGKGNPMKLFKVAQDPDNSIDVTEEQASSSTESNYEEVEDADDNDSFEDEEEAPQPKAVAPVIAKAATSSASSNKAKLQALIDKSRSK